MLIASSFCLRLGSYINFSSNSIYHEDNFADLPIRPLSTRSLIAPLTLPNVCTRPCTYVSPLCNPFSLKKGLGTDDHTLIRIVVTRCEVDMVEIKQAFLLNYHKTLAKMISVLTNCPLVSVRLLTLFFQDDTGGDYKRVLLAIVGE